VAYARLDDDQVVELDLAVMAVPSSAAGPRNVAISPQS